MAEYRLSAEAGCDTRILSRHSRILSRHSRGGGNLSHPQMRNMQVKVFIVHHGFPPSRE